MVDVPTMGQHEALTARVDALEQTSPPDPEPPPDRAGVWIPPGISLEAQRAIADENAVIRLEGPYQRLSLVGHPGQHIVTGPDGAQLDGEFKTMFAIVEADGMVIEGLPGAPIEAFGYNCQQQRGAFNGIDARRVVHKHLRSHHNHWYGFRAGPASTYQWCEAEFNGTLGFGGAAQDTLLEDVLIKGNRMVELGAPLTLKDGRPVNPGWEAGGLKLVQGSRLVLRRVNCNLNGGPGLWPDIDVIDPEIVDCIVEWNARAGIKLEIGRGGKVHGNVSRFNGWGKDAWLWGAQFQVQDTPDVEVYDNVAEVAGPRQAREIAAVLGIPVEELGARDPLAGYGDGIGIIDQLRTRRGKTYDALDNHVHDNRIVYHGRVGQCGEVDDDADKGSLARGAQRWERNTYVNAEGARWAHGSNQTWSQWVARYPTEMREAA